MSSRLKLMQEKGLINPPKWIGANMCYEVIMGSVAYGVSSDSSDMDVYGFCIPPKHIVFPHTAGVIHGFDTNFSKFEQYQSHHISAESFKEKTNFEIKNKLRRYSLEEIKEEIKKRKLL